MDGPEIVRLDQVEVTYATDVDDLIHRALLGRVGGSLPTDNAPLDWVLRVLAKVAGTPMADRICRAVATNLTAAEPEVRSQALIFFEADPHAPGSERITELFAGDRGLFTGVADPYHPSYDLESQLVRVFGLRLRPGDRTRMDLAREEVLRPGHAYPLIRSLTEVDPGWVDEHAEAIVAGTPAAGMLVIVGLYEKGIDPLGLARRLVPLCARSREFADLHRMIDDPAIRRAILDLRDRYGGRA